LLLDAQLLLQEWTDVLVAQIDEGQEVTRPNTAYMKLNNRIGRLLNRLDSNVINVEEFLDGIIDLIPSLLNMPDV
jgi:hypothetical protein